MNRYICTYIFIYLNFYLISNWIKSKFKKNTQILYKTSTYIQVSTYNGMPKSEHLRISDRWLWFGSNWFERLKSERILRKPNFFFACLDCFFYRNIFFIKWSRLALERLNWFEHQKTKLGLSVWNPNNQSFGFRRCSVIWRLVFGIPL